MTAKTPAIWNTSPALRETVPVAVKVMVLEDAQPEVRKPEAAVVEQTAVPANEPKVWLTTF